MVGSLLRVVTTNFSTTAEQDFTGCRAEPMVILFFVGDSIVRTVSIKNYSAMPQDHTTRMATLLARLTAVATRTVPNPTVTQMELTTLDLEVTSHLLTVDGFIKRCQIRVVKPSGIAVHTVRDVTVRHRLKRTTHRDPITDFVRTIFYCVYRTNGYTVLFSRSSIMSG